MCPHCGKPVVIQFKGTIYAKWLVVSLLLSAAVLYLFGIGLFGPVLVAVLFVPLVASLHVYPAA